MNTGPRNFNCPMTEAPCVEGACTKDICQRQTREEAEARRITLARERRRWENPSRITQEDIDNL
jgi:hypothetical protein